MFSILRVKCPHCGVEGQLMIPQQEALIVGPCPECNEFVVIFAGTVLSLEKSIMQSDNREEIYNHLHQVVSEHLKSCLNQFFENAEAPRKKVRRRRIRIHPRREASEITEQELQDFINNDLPKLDNPDYFRTIFGG